MSYAFNLCEICLQSRKVSVLFPLAHLFLEMLQKMEAAPPGHHFIFLSLKAGDVLMHHSLLVTMCLFVECKENNFSDELSHLFLYVHVA